MASVAALRSTMLYVHTDPLSSCVHMTCACEHDFMHSCLNTYGEVSKHQACHMAKPSSPGVVPEMLQQRFR